jgi:hypothetical protein
VSIYIWQISKNFSIKFVVHYDRFLCYVPLSFVKNYSFNKPYKVCYTLPSYKERVRLNRRENKWHSLDDFRSSRNTKFHKKVSLTSKIKKSVWKNPPLYVPLIHLMQNKTYKNISRKRCKRTVKGSRPINCVLTEVISKIIPPSLFPYTILVMTVPAPLRKTISRQTQIISPP